MRARAAGTCRGRAGGGRPGRGGGAVRVVHALVEVCVRLVGQARGLVEEVEDACETGGGRGGGMRARGRRDGRRSPRGAGRYGEIGPVSRAWAAAARAGAGSLGQVGSSANLGESRRISGGWAGLAPCRAPWTRSGRSSPSCPASARCATRCPPPRTAPAWRDMARHGETWRDMARHGEIWRDMGSSCAARGEAQELAREARCGCPPGGVLRGLGAISAGRVSAAVSGRRLGACSACSAAKTCWLKVACSFSFAKLMRSCSKPLVSKDSKPKMSRMPTHSCGCEETLFTAKGLEAGDVEDAYSQLRV